jgi:hypothetical protein
MIALTASQKIVVWTIGEDGKVSFTGESFSQPSPGNVKFFSAEWKHQPRTHNRITALLLRQWVSVV